VYVNIAPLEFVYRNQTTRVQVTCSLRAPTETRKGYRLRRFTGVDPRLDLTWPFANCLEHLHYLYSSLEHRLLGRRVCAKMPSSSNPVAGTPGHGIPQSKSFRTRLGFGGSGGSSSSGSSTKPSFFTQLKAGRKSFGGPGEIRPFERPVLAIYPEPEQQQSVRQGAQHP